MVRVVHEVPEVPEVSVVQGAAVYTALKQEEKGGCSDTWKSGW